ncbi:IpaC/SipC family type III secretion system effector [Pseudomonas chlororaphis]|uniref:IpaC/SipC family type III secretion system effector n=1 Tax=Pseudomonas chlororaphis TaxID=587753 RepID=UPI0030D2BDC0
MEITTRNAVPTTLDIGAVQVAQARVEQKQAVAVDHVAATVDAQVLASPAKLSFATMTPTQLKEYLDTSKFSEAESQAVMGLFFAGAVMEDKERSGVAATETVNELLSFNPGAWEKHIGVLMAAIVAVNVARKSSAEMSGVFTRMAFESAKAQGVAIKDGGTAAMSSALTGSAVAMAFTLGGAGLSIRGQNQKHTDIKTNQRNAANFDKSAEMMRVQLGKRPEVMISTPKTLERKNANGSLESIELKKGSEKLDPRDRAVLESEIRDAVAQAKQARMRSALNEKTYSRNMTVGGTLSALSMVLSTGLSSIVRLQEYAERQSEVLRGAEQGVNKAASDAANQMIGEDTALVGKMLDAIQQLADSRAATMSAVASARA